MKKKILVLALFISLISGCANNYTVKSDQIPINCEPYLYPRPLNMQPLNDIVALKDYWKLSANDWKNIVDWQHELDRYLEDVRVMQKNTEDCIDKYNQQIKTVAKQENKENTPAKKAWWKIW